MRGVGAERAPAGPRPEPASNLPLLLSARPRREAAHDSAADRGFCAAVFVRGCDGVHPDGFRLDGGGVGGKS